MMKTSFFLGAFAFAAWSMAPEPALAACEPNSEGVLSISEPGQHICRGDATMLKVTLNQIGFCSSYPDMAAGAAKLESCTNVVDDPIAVELGIGSTQKVAVVRPANGTYPYSYRLLSVRSQFAAVMEFADDMEGGSGQNVAGSFQTGKFCQPPSFEYDLNTVFSRVMPNECSAERPIEGNIGTYVANNLGLMSFEAVASWELGPSSQAVYAPSSTALTSAFLLDSDLNIITSPEDADSILVVIRNTPPIEISDDTRSLRIQFTLTDVVRATVTDFGNGIRHFYTPLLGIGAFNVLAQ
jgi:hypothetical protein